MVFTLLSIIILIVAPLVTAYIIYKHLRKEFSPLAQNRITSFLDLRAFLRSKRYAAVCAFFGAVATFSVCIIIPLVAVHAPLLFIPLTALIGFILTLWFRRIFDL